MTNIELKNKTFGRMSIVFRGDVIESCEPYSVASVFLYQVSKQNTLTDGNIDLV